MATGYKSGLLHLVALLAFVFSGCDSKAVSPARKRCTSARHRPYRLKYQPRLCIDSGRGENHAL